MLALLSCNTTPPTPPVGSGDTDAPVGGDDFSQSCDTLPPGDTAACDFCTLGELQCRDSAVATCVQGNGCTVWQVTTPCGLSEVCLDATCIPKNCQTGDTYVCSDPVHCKSGQRTCQNGVWGACVWTTLPGAEVCDGQDNDCDKLVDGADPDYVPALCPNQKGVCAGAKESCLGASGAFCGISTYSQNATASGKVYEAAGETRCDGDDNDCDGDVDEMRVNDPKNCGTCTHACPTGAICQNGECGCTAQGGCGADQVCDTATGQCVCQTGKHLCDGVCVDSTSPLSCGDLCTPCPEGPGTQATCTSGQCGVTCAVGYYRCGTACIANADCSLCRPCAPEDLSATAQDSQVVLDWQDRRQSVLGALPESPHPYNTSEIINQSYTLPGAQSLSVTFDPHTALGVGDTLAVRDNTGAAVTGSPFSGSALAGVTLNIQGDTVTLQLASDSVGTAWGHKVTGIVDERKGGAVSQYRLYWATAAGVDTADAVVANVAPPYIHGGRQNGTTYYYALAALGSEAEGPLSSEVSATPQGSGVERYRISGKVTGLKGSGLVLQLNHDETLTMSTQGSFSFVGTLPDTTAYSVTVQTQPHNPTQNCLVVHGSGTLAGANVTDVEVICSLQIATFNLTWFDAADSVAKKQALASLINTNGFDIVGIQEVASAGTVSDWITQYLDADEWSSRVGATGNTQRVGLLYRKSVLEMLDAGELNYSRSGGIINQTTYPWDGWMRVPYYGKLRVLGSAIDVEVVVNHLKSGGDETSCAERRDQANDLAEWIDAVDKTRLVMIGDFNDAISGNGICGSIDTLAALEQAQSAKLMTLQPTYMASGYYTFISSHKTLDHILVSPGLIGKILDLDTSAHKAAVVMHNDKSLSDHNPPYIWLGFE